MGALRPSAAAVHRGRRRVRQAELDCAIEQHAIWLRDRSSGRRAVFGSCDLSGLDFGANKKGQVLLETADFTESDLSYIRGDDINFYHVSLHSANLSHSHLKAPVFRGAILRDADCHDALWGWPSTDAWGISGRPQDIAVLAGSCLSGVNFDRARIRGAFYDCSLTLSSLDRTDFSYSEFDGDLTLNLFGRAKLIGTKFNHCRIKSARFNRAIIRETEFYGADIDWRIKAHLATRDGVRL